MASASTAPTLASTLESLGITPHPVPVVLRAQKISPRESRRRAQLYVYGWPAAIPLLVETACLPFLHWDPTRILFSIVVASGAYLAGTEWIKKNWVTERLVPAHHDGVGFENNRPIREIYCPGSHMQVKGQGMKTVEIAELPLDPLAFEFNTKKGEQMFVDGLLEAEIVDAFRWLSTQDPVAAVKKLYEEYNAAGRQFGMAFERSNELSTMKDVIALYIGLPPGDAAFETFRNRFLAGLPREEIKPESINGLKDNAGKFSAHAADMGIRITRVVIQNIRLAADVQAARNRLAAATDDAAAKRIHVDATFAAAKQGAADSGMSPDMAGAIAANGMSLGSGINMNAMSISITNPDKSLALPGVAAAGTAVATILGGDKKKQKGASK